MGYESRIDVLEAYETTATFASKIATIEMAGCDTGFMELFDKKDRAWDFGLDTRCVFDKNTEGKTFSSIVKPDSKDCYGSLYTYTDDVEKVIKWLEQEIVRATVSGESVYRRYTMLLGLLKAMPQKSWNHLYIVHSGY